MLLTDKVALITGAGNGIGRATAQRFAREGALLVISDVDETALAETRQMIEAEGGKVTALVANVASRLDAQQMVDTAVAHYGTLHILINNAGITRDGLTARIKDDQVQFMPEDHWDTVLNVNLKGTWLCSQCAAVPMMKNRYGRIVNTASIAALGNVGQANYSASKAGVIGLTKTLALEWARFGIAVNCVAPGGVRTRMTDTIPEKVMTGLIDGIPFKRFAEPEEIAAAHVWLASGEAAYITGQVLFVDGGITAGA